MQYNEDILKEVLEAYSLTGDLIHILPLDNGLINHTWKITGNHESYIIQKINTTVFRHPESITANIKKIGDYLVSRNPGYLFVRPVPAQNGKEMIQTPDGYFRIFPFVEGSHTIDVVQSPGEAYEAARQFGLFTSNCSGFPVEQLEITLPDFHNLSLRYQQFTDALLNGNPVRIERTRDLIDFSISKKELVDTFESIRVHPGFRLRVTHHDTKISNVLFDEEGKGLCVIDLDTVMPGYFISDIGDMLRTYLSPVNEGEGDLSKIEIREDFFVAIWKGYMSAMASLLSVEEQQYFTYAGKFMIYMQALRFLTDYLNNDIYYKITYEDQNLIRTQNQLTLLQLLSDKESQLQQLITG
jgi:Ser/Thr protein kinase RdoA (MazF antagonist)